MHKSSWYENIFIQGSVLHYFAPEVLQELLLPKTGFRAGLGYEAKNFLFTIESGYSRIEGTNPLVKEIKINPLFFKFGYNFPVKFGFGVQAETGLGFIFSRTKRYETALEMIMENLQEDKIRSPVIPARLFLTWYLETKKMSWEFLKLYAGGGADIVFETEGPIPLPLFEAGISVKPFMLAKKISKNKSEKIDTKNIDFTHRSENIIVQETAQGRTVRLLNAVYFEADSSVMLERYRPVINAAGERLRADPSLRVTLRAYAAPFGTPEGQRSVSAGRANYCAEYLAKEYGIAKDRITSVSFGTERVPEFRDATWESYRCVEIIIEGGR